MPNFMEADKSMIRICKLCGGLFYYKGFGYGYCDRCVKIDDENFHRVKEYIWDHVGASVVEVSDQVNVSVKQIYAYIKDGRLEIPEGSPIYLKCEMCGTDIRYGRYCPDCATHMHKKLSSVTEADLCEIGERPSSSKKGRIHFQYEK